MITAEIRAQDPPAYPVPMNGSPTAEKPSRRARSSIERKTALTAS